MVRRLPVLQPASEASPPLSVPRATLLVVPLVLSCWAVLLWGLRHFGATGAAAAFFVACGAGAAILGHRVAPARRAWFCVVATPATAVSTWLLAVFGGAFGNLELAVGALAALLGLAAVGFGTAIFVLLRRQRAERRLRH